MEAIHSNLSLDMSFVPSNSNQADWFSRRLSPSDAMLSPTSWDLVQRLFGGANGHLDLTAILISCRWTLMLNVMGKGTR
ncbi:unnamed protein product [Porites lobata]|uniref:Uncharacterized protein n=1 Tax=Porites lobata TaxID=104759 RepID=A0ABN8PRR1_9CNID|nr:unnamed protein product [Porites lobata]